MFIFLGGVDREGYSSGQIFPQRRLEMTANPGNFGLELVQGAARRNSRFTGKLVRADTTMFGMFKE